MRKALISLLLSFPLLGADLEFKEAFTDPARREESLGRLVPGTRDWFFYHALAAQLAGRHDEFLQTLGRWKAAGQDRQRPVPTDGLEILENRELLLRYEADPQGSLTRLIQQLDLHFDATRPDSRAEESLPDRLDPATISAAAFEKEMTLSLPAPWAGYTDERLFRELDQPGEPSPEKTAWFRSHLKRADHPATVPLMARALSFKNAATFGAAPLDLLLDHAQLEALLTADPALRGSEALAIRYLATLMPDETVDFERTPTAQTDHLARCRDFALTLPPALVSLKAHVLYHHLRLQREAGRFPLEDFIAYLRLPRSSHPLLKPASGEGLRVDQDLDYTVATGCPPIGDDRELIEACLQHFLATAADSSAFDGLIERATLRRLQARAKLLAGADSKDWAEALDPAEVLALQQETRIAFAPGQPSFCKADETVRLALDLKNTPRLLVRIFELDLPSIIAREGEEPQVNLDLDGLVPHAERQLSFTQPPMTEHRESLELPELAGAGAWIVECVSGNATCRTLIRKGSLVPFVERIAGGQRVRVFDPAGEAVADAEVRIGSETFTAGADGRITIPNREAGGRTEALVVRGKLATPLLLEDRLDDWSLETRFHLDREQLLADGRATVLLHTRLAEHDHEVPLDRLTKVSLTLHADLLGKLSADRLIAEDLKLTPRLEVPFQVPADARSITLRLHGEIVPAAGAEPQPLEQEMTWTLNAQLESDRIAGAYFTRSREGHRLEIRGRNGEPLASRGVSLEFRHRDYESTLTLRLRTDASGAIRLGALDGITQVTVTGEDFASASYQPEDPAGWFALPTVLDLAAGEELDLPWPFADPALSRARVSLLAMRSGQILHDEFARLALQDGRLVTKGLPTGFYRLTLDKAVHLIRVSPGKRQDDLLVSTSRIVPRYAPAIPRAIATVEGDRLLVRLDRAVPGTRISLIGQRFLSSWNAGTGLAPFAAPRTGLFIPGFRRNEFLTERRLSDEQRYILDRRAAKTFPGSLLPRPGLLIHRWSDEEISQQDQKGSGGEEGHGTGTGSGSSSASSSAAAPPQRVSGAESVEALDFLADPSVIRYELEPDATGLINLPLADFADSQVIRIVAANADGIHDLLVPLPPASPALRDRRLTRALDPARHYLGTRAGSVLAKGAEASIEGMLDADWRAFTTLRDAFDFLAADSKDSKMEDFRPLLDWPTLDEKTKLDFVSRHACHELNLFLARKDPDFFVKFVKPQLAEKREPTVIDDILLDRDLQPYLRPFAWQRLNAAEKALLARALPADRARISREMSLRWKTEAPSPEEETLLFARTLRGSDFDLHDSLGMARRSSGNSGGALASTASAYMVNKLRSIVIPLIDFEDSSIEEAIDFLRLRSAELDTSELDPSKKGINFVVRRPMSGGSDSGSVRIKELRLRNVPLTEALKYICEGTRLRYKIDDFAVTILPATETDEDLVSRTFDVPDGLMSRLGASARQQRNGGIKEILVSKGIPFPDGSMATLSGNNLIIRNSSTAIDLLEQLFSAASMDAPAGAADPFAPSEMAEPDPFASDESPAELPNSIGSLLSRPAWSGNRDHTRLWREANYDEYSGSTDESFIPLNGFWTDLAAWDGQGPFLSPHFNACGRHANEALLCLALLDLPFSAGRPETRVEGSALRVKAREPMLLFYRDTREAAAPAGDPPVLVRQTFHPLAERFHQEDGRAIENTIVGEFVAGVPYGMSLVITNPSGAGRRIDLLAQIPAGAIPLKGEPATRASTHELKPYGVFNGVLAFYFPAPGDFPVYPLHVNENAKVLAAGAARTLHVVASGSPEEATSWPALARDGAPEAVLARLRQVNPADLDLAAILWRLHDRSFYQQVAALLRERLFFSPSVAAYAFHHRDVEGMRDYLENTGMLDHLGDWLDSPLLQVRPVTHRGWETVDFDPLVNPRAHRFAEYPRLSHPQALADYERFLDGLAWKAVPDDDDRLVLCVRLLLQDRTEEGLAMFDRIDAAKLRGRLPYDYLHAVVLFHRGEPAAAKALATAHATEPPGLWRERFDAVIAQADEVAALAHGAPAPVQDAHPAAPSLTIAPLPDGNLQLKHQGLSQAGLKFFNVDLEMLFSKDPFLTDNSAALPGIRPNETREIALDATKSETLVPLPPAFRHGNVLVAATAGNTRSIRILDSPALEIVRQPEDRTIQVLDAAARTPRPRAYVKVYALTASGEIAFHKDGYTDLRGKFDYLTHTGANSTNFKRLAILVVDPEKGSRIEIVEL